MITLPDCVRGETLDIRTDIGIISDTHGQVRPEALTALADCELILHVCDIGKFGHSHKPFSETKEGVLYFNPGSAGPRRFSLPVTVGRLRVTDTGVEDHIEELDVPGPRRRG